MKNYADRELCQEIYKRKLIMDAEMWWHKDNEVAVEKFHCYWSESKQALIRIPKVCPAYNCTELLDALPQTINKYELCISKLGVRYTDFNWYNLKVFYGETVNALAKMLLYLDDKKLLKKGE